MLTTQTPKYPEVYFVAAKGDLSKLKHLIEAEKHDIKALTDQVEINLFHYAVFDNAILKYLTDPALKLYEKFADGTTELHGHVVCGRNDKFDEFINPIQEQQDKLEKALFASQNEENEAVMAIRRKLAEAQSKLLNIINKVNDRSENVFYWAGCVGNFVLLDHLWKYLPDDLLDEDRIALLNDAIAGATWTARAAEQRKSFSIAIGFTKKIRDYLLYMSELAPDEEFGEDVKLYKSKIKELKKAELEEFNEKQIILMKALKKSVLQYGFECQNIERDGNCFFTAVLHQLSIHPERNNIIKSLVPPNTEVTTHFLRQLAVKHLRAHKDTYSSYIYNQSYNEYLAEINTPGAWADQLVMMALAREIKVSLVILSLRDDQTCVLKTKDSLATIYLGHEPEMHYQSLVSKPELTQVKSVEAIFAATECLEELAPVGMSADEIKVEAADVKFDETIVKLEFTVESPVSQASNSTGFMRNDDDNELTLSDWDDDVESINSTAATVGSTDYTLGENRFGLFCHASDDLMLKSKEPVISITRSKSFS